MDAPLGELGILGVLGLLGTLEPMTAPPASRVIPNKALPMPELLPGRTLGDTGCCPGRIGLAGMENKRELICDLQELKRSTKHLGNSTSN